MHKTAVILLAIFAVAVYAQMEMTESKGETSEDMFVHPFLAHMGLPDRPGDVSLRTHILQTNTSGRLTTDFGVRIEAGLLNMFGIHLRNTAIREEEYSELLLQFSPLADKSNMNGIAAFGELEIPTAADKSTHYKGVAGLSGEFTIGSIMTFNGAFEYDFNEEDVEYEGSFVFKASDLLYPVIDYNGDLSGDVHTLYILPALKFRVAPNSVFGAGAQIAVTRDREFDIRALFTYELIAEM